MCVKTRANFQGFVRGELDGLGVRRIGSLGDAMAGSTYYAESADQLGKAQALLDEHVTSSGTGRCLACGSPGPCWRRENAVVIFSRTLRLPVRRPGATRPELVGAVRIGVRGGLAG